MLRPALDVTIYLNHITDQINIVASQLTIVTKKKCVPTLFRYIVTIGTGSVASMMSSENTNSLALVALVMTLYIKRAKIASGYKRSRGV